MDHQIIKNSFPNLILEIEEEDTIEFTLKTSYFEMYIGFQYFKQDDRIKAYISGSNGLIVKSNFLPSMENAEEHAVRYTKIQLEKLSKQIGINT